MGDRTVATVTMKERNRVTCDIQISTVRSRLLLQSKLGPLQQTNFDHGQWRPSRSHSPQSCYYQQEQAQYAFGIKIYNLFLHFAKQFFNFNKNFNLFFYSSPSTIQIQIEIVFFQSKIILHQRNNQLSICLNMPQHVSNISNCFVVSHFRSSCWHLILQVFNEPFRCIIAFC